MALSNGKYFVNRIIKNVERKQKRRTMSLNFLRKMEMKPEKILGPYFETIKKRK